MILLYVKKKFIEKGGGWLFEIKGIGIFINCKIIYFY